MVSFDFIEGLPRSNRYDCILVVVDKFSKYNHFLPVSHPFSASQVVATYLDQVYRLHGLPDSLIYDRDPVFTSRFWQHLFRKTYTTLRMSTPYHPATDGQTERVNQCLETFLRCFIHSCPKMWSTWLPLAEFWYSTTQVTTVRMASYRSLCCMVTSRDIGALRLVQQLQSRN